MEKNKQDLFNFLRPISLYRDLKILKPYLDQGVLNLILPELSNGNPEIRKATAFIISNFAYSGVWDYFLNTNLIDLLILKSHDDYPSV